jgi:hypothetical protein
MGCRYLLLTVLLIENALFIGLKLGRERRPEANYRVRE